MMKQLIMDENQMMKSVDQMIIDEKQMVKPMDQMILDEKEMDPDENQMKMALCQGVKEKQNTSSLILRQTKIGKDGVGCRSNHSLLMSSECDFVFLADGCKSC